MAEQDVIQPTQSDIAAIQTSISTSSSNAERDELMKKFPETFKKLQEQYQETGAFFTQNETASTVDVEKLAELQDEYVVGSTEALKKKMLSPDDSAYTTEQQIKELGFGVDELEYVSGTDVATGYPKTYLVDNETKIAYTPYDLWYNLPNRRAQTSDYSTNEGTNFISVSPTNKQTSSLISKTREKLVKMGLKKESFDPATGKSLGLKDTDEMTAMVKPFLGAVLGGPGALLATGVSWFAKGRAQQKAAVEMIKDIDNGTFSPDKRYLTYSGKELFRKMATTFADPLHQMQSIYKKAGISGNAIDNFFNYAVQNDFIDVKTLRDLEKYRPSVADEVYKAYKEADKQAPDTTFYSSQFQETLPEGSKKFSTIKVGDTTVQETYQTPTGQMVSTGMQSQIQPSPPSPSQPSPSPVTSGNTPAFSGSSFFERQEGGPIPADNLELVNEPQKDMSGVADDVPRNLDEGDFVINAPAVKQAGKSDIEKMINKAVTELQRKGIKLDFGQTAEDIDKAINTLVSNGEVIIPKVLAEQIGYDRLEKINNRGKEKVKELDAQQEQMAQQSPTMQQPVMAQLGGAVGNIPNPYEQQNGFMSIAEQMPTSKFLTQTQVGQNIMQPTQQMQEGGNKIEIKKKPSITNLELVRNSLNSQNDIASLRPEAIAGILGNIAVETGDTFDYRTQQRGGPGQGLFQFEGGHLRAYEEYKRKNRLQPSINAQVRYMLDNIYNGIGFDLGFKNRKDLQKALEEGTTEQVADTFAKLFENPRDETAQYDKRIQRAKEIYDNLFRPSPQKSFKLSQTKEQAMQDIDTMEPVYDTGMMAQQ